VTKLSRSEIVGFGCLECTDTQREQLDTKAVSLTEMEPDCARGALITALSKTGRILLSLSAPFGHFCWSLLRAFELGRAVGSAAATSPTSDVQVAAVAVAEVGAIKV
jgi:hypothetical protein